MLKRHASKKQTERYKAYVRNKYKRHVRFKRNFETIEEVENCMAEHLNDKYPKEILEDVYRSYNFKFGKDSNHRAEILMFYRHPSKQYKDMLLAAMEYRINSANSTRAFIGGDVIYYFSDNELRTNSMKI